MRIAALALALIMGAGPAFASMTCWYDENGDNSGIDQTPGWVAHIPVGQAALMLDDGPNSWAYNIDDGYCPARIPAEAFTDGAGADSNPLTCWYDETLAYTGADSGNHGAEGTRIGESAKVAESGDYTWAYIIDGWADDASCPAEIPTDALPG